MAKGIEPTYFVQHREVIAATDKPETPPSGRVAGPYRKADGIWYEMGSDGVEKPLFDGDEVVYKAAAAASTINKVNAYAKLADIGAAPAIKKGGIYSTFTLDTGTLSSYIAKEDASAWVAVASLPSPGVYCGFAATFAALPATRRDSSVRVVGDMAFLTAKDGTNLAGLYRWNGTAWVFEFAFATASDAWQTLTITAAKQSVYTLSPVITSDAPIVSLNGQEIKATVNAAKDTLTLTDANVIAIIETSDSLRVRG